jgi:glucose-6-phosphate isomerase, archaeal
VTMFCYAADAGQDYSLIERAGGMATLVVQDGDGGWTTRPNPDHTGYPPQAG